MSLSLQVKVVPGSGKLCCVLDKQQRLKCFLKAQAEQGKANKELIKFLAKACGITQQDVMITAGLTSRNKTVLINADMSYDQFLQKMGIEKQGLLF